jgi:hypothetical protein
MKKIITATLFLIFLMTSSSVFAETPSFNVLWKQGIILGVLVPPSTPKEQLKDLIYKFKQAKKDQTISSLIPPVTVGLKDKYRMVVIYVFSDSKWAQEEEYNKYKHADDKTTKGRVISKAYLNHIAAYYEFTIDNKEYGSLGVSEFGYKSAHYEKLF